MYARKDAVWGVAPPYSNNLIGTVASGRIQSGPFKTGHKALLARALLQKLWPRLIESLQKRSQPLTSGRALNNY